MNLRKRYLMFTDVRRIFAVVHYRIIQRYINGYRDLVNAEKGDAKAM